MTATIRPLAVFTSIALVLAATGCAKSASSNDPRGSSSSYAELGIVLSNLDDEEVSLVSETDRDIHVLAFWATWCIPCLGELAKMQGVHERLAERGVKFYAITVDGPDTIARVPGFAAQEGWTYPVLYDTDTAVLTRWNPKGDCPFFVVLDADGSVLKTHQGYVKGDVVKLERFLMERLSAE